MSTPTYTLADFDFELPPELIAQHPAAERSASRLLDASGAGAFADRAFRDLPSLLAAGDLLVFNDTRVVKARLLGRKRPSGGAVEALVERVLAPGDGGDGGDGGHRVLAHLRASKTPKPGAVLRFDGPAPDGSDGFDARVVGRGGAGGALFELDFPADPYLLLERCGRVPLPPYIAHADDGDDGDDERRYQTVFARVPGAVAAPTAALHFDAEVLAALAARGVRSAHVTLHVGAGTFQPVRGDDIDAHVMHSERYEVGAATLAAVAETRARGGRVLAVGTTTLRALESAALAGAFDAASPPPQGVAGETAIFIRPGFTFRAVDLLLTNFHLPKSTLLMLVSAFAGHARMRDLYRHAVAAHYRFFSYGDAMLLARA